MSLLAVGLGAVLAAAGWACARQVAGTRLRLDAGLLLDAGIPLAVGGAILALTCRPAFSGLVIFALLGGLAVADHFKRETLKEPVVFSDRAELLELVRHPELYLPFVGPLRVMAGATAILLALTAAPWLEPPAFAAPWPARLGGPALLLGFVAAVMWPLLQPVTRLLRGLGPLGEPAADTARFGPVATLFVYGLIARGERRGRREAVRAAGDAALPSPARRGGHIVLVQAESFLDVRRRWADAPAGLLPAFDALLPTSAHGLMTAPTWGASTVRTEFEVLTGSPLGALGLDAFNPYERFARAPLPSLAWRLREAGYRTLCLHPYDRRFYGRDRVLPRLGFERFDGAEAFARPAAGYVSDAALAEHAEGVLRAASQPTFLFLITMENHGPWSPTPGDATPGAAAYLRGLGSADALLARMQAAVAPSGGVVAFYGDHGPMLPGLEDVAQTDWLVSGPGLAPERTEISAHHLPAQVLRAVGPAQS